VFLYPTGDPATGDDDWRSRPFGEGVTIAGLDAHVVAPIDPVASGDDGRAEFVLTNVGTPTVELGTSMYLRRLCARPQRRCVLGGYTGGLPQPAIEFWLQPGQSRTMGFVFGTASYRPQLGYALPPGRYRLGVGVPLVGSDSHGCLKVRPASC
jgi:hypothetical protein